ncbi:hypothetical protein C0991_006191 [Blastosporella zonata]|nr:hypothetical protein C0991_006191 [Blastosporella zonata]
MDHPDIVQVKGTQPYLQFQIVEYSAILLETIQNGTGADYLLYGNSDLASIPSIRPLFIVRICRALCLLGYNIANIRLRTVIHTAITSIYRVDWGNHWLYRPYVRARGWRGLVLALRNMTQGSLVDELVQLHDLGRQSLLPVRPVSGVHIAPYKAYSDIHQILGASSSLSVESAGTESEHDLTAASVDDEMDVGAIDEEDDVAGIEETNNDAWPSDTPEAISAMSSADMPQAQPPSEEEQRAASIILKNYRRVLLRRSQAAEATSTSLVAKISAECLKQSYDMSWDDNSGYRFLFLGPLPHILLCLDIALATTSAQKKSTKKRWREESHDKLDGLGLRLTELAYVDLVGNGKLSKSLVPLQKILEPTSNIHRCKDVGELRRRVRETAELLQSLPFPTTEQFQKDLSIAVKGILMARQPLKPKSKPDLVCEDDI